MTQEGDGPRPAEMQAAPAGDAWAEPLPAAYAAPGPAARSGLWPFVLLLVMGIVWGSTFSLAKIATEGGAHPLGLSLWQGLLGGVILLIVCLLRRRAPILNWHYAGFYLICGLLGTVLPGTLFFYAAPHVPAGILSITVATVPILTYAMTLPLRVERLSAGRVAGILLGMLSVVLLVAPASSLPSRDMVPWVLVAILASAFYAAENLFVALRRPAGSDVLALVAGMLFMAALVLAPIVWATGTYVPLGLPWGPVEWSVVAMTVANAIAYSLFVWVISMAGPVFASQTAYTVTIAGVLWGMAVFGERHSLWIWASLAVMLAGLALVTPKAKQ
jgi:drug/metabolite transporter (DMT)-like permease